MAALVCSFGGSGHGMEVSVWEAESMCCFGSESRLRDSCLASPSWLIQCGRKETLLIDSAETVAMLPSHCLANFKQTFEMSQKNELDAFLLACLEQINQGMQSVVASEIDINHECNKQQVDVAIQKQNQLHGSKCH